MSPSIRLDSMSQLRGVSVLEPQGEDSTHTTVITNNASSIERLGDEKFLKNTPVTLVEFPSGERGGAGVDLMGLIQEPIFWVFTAVTILSKGFLEGFSGEVGKEVGQIFTDKIREKFANHHGPSQYYIQEQDSYRTLVVIAPDDMSIDDIKLLELLSIVEMKKMPKHGGYSRVLFSPKDKKLIYIHKTW